MLTSLLILLIWLLVIGLILGLCIWIIDQMPFIPAQFKAVAKVILLVVALILLLLRVLPMAGVAVP